MNPLGLSVETRDCLFAFSVLVCFTVESLQRDSLIFLLYDFENVPVWIILIPGCHVDFLHHWI